MNETSDEAPKVSSPVDRVVMPLPKMEAISLDELTQICGMFDGQSELNNGYGCRATQNTQAPGCCYSFSCPIAVELDDEDEGWDESFSPGDWMKQHSEFK